MKQVLHETSFTRKKTLTY